MRRILVPVDFSTTSKKAFRFAVDIVAKTKGMIVLYHLYTPGKKITLGSRKNIDEYNKKTETNSLKRLNRLKKKVLEETGAGVVISTVVGRTPILNNILGFAEHNQMDMIVLGTQGASGLKKVTIGSVASKIMAEADLPVLLIPEKFEMKPLENIVFTTDMKKTDKKALPLVFDFAGLYDASLTVVNIFLKLYEGDKTSQKNFESFTKYVDKRFNTSNVRFIQLDTNSVAKKMENLSKELQFDALAMARRKLNPRERFFQKSFTKQMAFITTQPLMVIPEE